MTGTALATTFSRNDSRKLALFKNTTGKELVGSEIDMAVEWCELYGANPLIGDIMFFVFDADKPAKRRVTPVLTIQQYRKIAKRTGCYRPDERPARFRYDQTLVSSANPRGIVDCELSIFIFEQGEWFPVTERIRWEERAPVKERWENDQPTGHFFLDPKKKNWRSMPETMLAKCVEAACIRKAFPEQTAGSYVEGEMDHAHTIDLTATEIIESEAQKRREAAIGGVDTLTVDWLDGGALDRVQVGEFADKFMAWARGKPAKTLVDWQGRNRYVLQEYWAKDKAGALAIKAELEEAGGRLAQEQADLQNGEAA